MRRFRICKFGLVIVTYFGLVSSCFGAESLIVKNTEQSLGTDANNKLLHFKGGTFNVAGIQLDWVSNDQIDDSTAAQIQLQLTDLIANNVRIAGYILSKFLNNRVPIQFVTHISDSGKNKELQLFVASEITDSQLANVIEFFKGEVKQLNSPVAGIKRIADLFGPMNKPIVPNDPQPDPQLGINSSGTYSSGNASSLVDTQSPTTAQIKAMTDQQFLRHMSAIINLREKKTK